MPQRTLLLYTAVLGGIALLSMGVQLVAVLYGQFAGEVRWSVEQLTPCELEVPAPLFETLAAERRAEIVPDTVRRLIADVDYSYRSGPARSVQRAIWLWLLPQSLEQEQLLGLYLRSWPHRDDTGERGMCAAARRRYGRELSDLRPAELRALLAEEATGDG